MAKTTMVLVSLEFRIARIGRRDGKWTGGKEGKAKDVGNKEECEI